MINTDNVVIATGLSIMVGIYFKLFRRKKPPVVNKPPRPFPEPTTPVTPGTRPGPDTVKPTID